MPKFSRFEEAVFVDDFFRSSDNTLDSHPSNRKFLRALFEPSCRRLGIPVREVHAESDGGNIAVASAMQRLGLEASASGWAAASVADLRNATEDLQPLNVTSRSLIIGWGMPPSLLSYLTQRGAVFIDVEVDPLRFGRHLYLCARTNDAQVADALSALEVSTESFWDAATTINCSFARKGVDYLVAPGMSVGLFAGQTAVDLALVRGGRLGAPEDYLDDLRRMAEEVDVMLIKPHPYAGDTVHLDTMLEQIPNAIPTNLNIYAMFTARNLRFVTALSSGALKEAAFFGVDGRALIAPDRNNPDRLPKSCSRWLTIGAGVGSLAVVERICEQRSWLSRLKRTRDPAPLGFSPDALDQIFGARWGLNFDAPGLPESCLFKAESAYTFAQGDGATGWLGAGWHDPESWGVWGASTCELFLPFNAGLLTMGESLVFELIGHVHADASVSALEVGGVPLQFHVEKCGDHQIVKSEVASDQVFGRRHVRLTLRVQGAARPMDVTGLPDGRTLGFGLRALVARKCVSSVDRAASNEGSAVWMDNPETSVLH